MKAATKVLFISAAAVAVAGMILIGISFAMGGDKNLFKTTNVTHTAEGKFTDISVSSSMTDIIVKLSDDGKTYAVCSEDEKITFSLSVENGVLCLEEKDNSTWKDHIGISFDTRRATLYLSESEYENITVNTESGSIKCENGLYFNSASVTASSGSISINAQISEKLYACTSSGGIEIADVSPRTLDVSAQSGSVHLVNINTSNASARSSSGSIKLLNVVCDSIMNVKSSGGSINIDMCDAPQMVLNSASGNIKGTVLTDKIFNASSNSGKIDCPASVNGGGTCTVSTSSGNIKLKIAE